MVGLTTGSIFLIYFFKAIDLDFLVCIRTCPYQSWQNIAERVMATLNLALQNVSLCRKQMSPGSEKLVQNKSTLKEIRGLLASHGDLKGELRDSVAAPMIALSTRIQSLTLKDVKFAVHSAASDEDIDEFFDHILFIEPHLERDHLRKADLKEAKHLKKFMDQHCHISQYVFQIRKCKDQACYYCTEYPVRLPEEVFASLSFLPLPRLDESKKHYQSFSDLYGKEVISECDRPSLVPDDENSQVDKENSNLFRNTRVRRVIHCQECSKPRCIYSSAAFSAQEKLAVNIIDESFVGCPSLVT
jgi:hypothetical protein